MVFIRAVETKPDRLPHKEINTKAMEILVILIQSLQIVYIYENITLYLLNMQYHMLTKIKGLELMGTKK